MDIFKQCINPDQVKAEYVRLVSLPSADLASINQAFFSKLASLDGAVLHGKKADGSQYRYTYSHAASLSTNNEFIETVSKLKALSMADASILVRGSWLWIEGNTLPYKDQLKAIGCRYNARRTKEAGHGVWHYAPQGARKPRRRSSLAYNQLSQVYGEERL